MKRTLGLMIGVVGLATVAVPAVAQAAYGAVPLNRVEHRHLAKASVDRTEARRLQRRAAYEWRHGRYGAARSDRRQARALYRQAYRQNRRAERVGL